MSKTAEAATQAIAHSGHIKSLFATALAAFGVMIEPQAFLAGMLLALSGAYLAAIWFPEKDKHELWQVLALAVFSAFMIAIMHEHFLKEIPVQFKMAAVGFGSRLIIRGAWKWLEGKTKELGK